jgi:hypothetical protein
MFGFSPISDQPISSVPGAGGTAYTLTCDAGAYTIGGQDAALIKSRIVVADTGAYAVAGQDATLLKSKVVTADAGAYTLVGQDATLTYTPSGTVYTLTCDAGAYTLSGQDATINYTGAAVTATRRKGFAGFPRSHLWIAHINGKRYVGTYEELEAALGEVVEKTARKPRIVIKPGRVVTRTAEAQPVATVEQAKAVQHQLAVDIGPMLAAAVRQREEDEDEDLMLLL